MTPTDQYGACFSGSLLNRNSRNVLRNTSSMTDRRQQPDYFLVDLDRLRQFAEDLAVEPQLQVQRATNKDGCAAFHETSASNFQAAASICCRTLHSLVNSLLLIAGEAHRIRSALSSMALRSLARKLRNQRRGAMPEQDRNNSAQWIA